MRVRCIHRECRTRGGKCSRLGLQIVTSEYSAHHLQVLEGLEAVRKLRFLYEGTGRTIGQAAILFSLASPAIKSVLPNITSEENLREFAQAPDKAPLSEEEMRRIEELWTSELAEKLKQPLANSKVKPTPVAAK